MLLASIVDENVGSPERRQRIGCNTLSRFFPPTSPRLVIALRRSGFDDPLGSLPLRHLRKMNYCDFCALARVKRKRILQIGIAILDHRRALSQNGWHRVIDQSLDNWS